MKKEFILKPLIGVEYQGKAINFGEPIGYIEKILGKPCSPSMDGKSRRYFYCENNIAFDFDSENRLEFIEFLAGKEGPLNPHIYGEDAFELPADELVALLTTHNNGEIENNENGYSYGFKNISVGLYRESTPLAIEESRQEMIVEGCSNEEIEDYIAYERKRSDYWSCIGLGKKGYYQ